VPIKFARHVDVDDRHVWIYVSPRRRTYLFLSFVVDVVVVVVSKNGCKQYSAVTAVGMEDSSESFGISYRFHVTVD